MKKFGLLMFLLAIVAMLGVAAQAQPYNGDNSLFFTTYYSANQANAPDATLRVINDGSATSANLYADIFVFDDSEELTECCSCLVTPDGLLSESVKLNLTYRTALHSTPPFVLPAPTRGVIKVVSSSTPFIAPTFAPETPTVGLRVWMTHIQGTKVTLSAGNPVIPVVAGPFFVTETPGVDSNLGGGELTLIEALCHFNYLLSSSACICQLEDYDF